VDAPTVNLGYYPRDWQREVHRSLRRFSVLALHRRAGKTVLAVAELVDKAIKADRRPQAPPRYAYIAPFKNQAKTIAWAKLKLRVGPLIASGAVKIDAAELKVTFLHNDATITLFGADNADAIRGDYFDGVVMDEVAQMEPDVWHDIVRPMLADYLGWALFIGTPNGVNLFSELYQAAARGLAGWFARSYTVYETNALDPVEVETMRQSMAPQSFEREMLCSFDVPGVNQLVSTVDIIEAQRRHLRPEDYQFAPKIIGVDPARFGDDRSVIVKRQGLLVHPPIVLPGIDNSALVDRILDEKLRWGADAIFCDAGQGAGVIDWLRRLGHDCVEVWFNGKPSQPQYYDKRTEIWCEMAETIPMMSLPPDPKGDMKRDLTAPCYKFERDSKKRLESKDDVKKRILMSPDIGDALAVTWAQPVAVKTAKEKLYAAARVDVHAGVPEYDPFAR
jgi:hypothetical protein